MGRFLKRGNLRAAIAYPALDFRREDFKIS